MERKGPTFIFIFLLLISLLFSSLIYNAEVFFGIATKVFSERVVKYIVFLLFAFLCFIYLNRRFSISSELLFIFILFPFILIDIFTVIKDQRYFPLRFPLVTLFPFIGSLLGYYYTKTKNKLFWITIVAGLIYIGLFIVYFSPYLTYRIFESKNIVRRDKEIVVLEDSFTTINGNKVKIKDTISAPKTILSFFFVGCSPCEQLKGAIKKVIISSPQDEVEAVMICNGKITDFKTFQKYVSSHENEPFIYLYDNEGVACNKLGIEGYPFEVISKRSRILSSINGFDLQSENIYIRKRLQLINEKANTQ